MNDEGYTALLWAAQKGFLGIVKMLQTHGADIRDLTNRGRNALVIAAGRAISILSLGSRAKNSML